MNHINFLDDSKEINFNVLNKTIQDELISGGFYPNDINITIKKISLKQKSIILSETYFDGGVDFSSRIYLKENLKEIMVSGTYISMSSLFEIEDEEKTAYALLRIYEEESYTFILVEMN